ncbi:MAG: IS1182 family transposase [candidate division Zixibacteria bacterium]|nr:IS1182 family transposase [candidate division Zixibacteria bacterium]MBU1470027.1 IS1182 family transposase [candidate division Zixibacteria bacterium]
MAYRYGKRHEQSLFPASIEDYVPSDAPVRVYDVFVDALDFGDLGIELDSCKVGNSSYDPRSMLKLLVYGYSYGIRSSRKLERETHYNLSFIWLTGGLKPDHKTIAEFRRKHKGALRKVLKQCARLCLKLNLIAGNTLFVDGSKVRANASLSHHWTEDRCLKRLEKIDGRIEEILSECDLADDQESGIGSLVAIQEELSDQQTLRRKVQDTLKQLQSAQKASINTTDPDCVRIHGRQGSHAGYNMQSVIDEKEGLIVHTDVVNDNNDLGQISDQVEGAHEVLDKPCKTVCADAGYCNYDELEKLDGEDIKLVVPSKRQASKKPAKPFDKSKFEYDSENDVYICPAGQTLSYRYTREGKKKDYMAGVSVCCQCCYFGECTTNSRDGRKIVRYVNEEFRERLESEYEQPDSQAIYELRKQKAELPFGHIKRNLNADHFLLRGLDGVRAEASLLASCFNLARMITLIGVPALIAKLAN